MFTVPATVYVPLDELSKRPKSTEPIPMVLVVTVLVRSVLPFGVITLSMTFSLPPVPDT